MSMRIRIYSDLHLEFSPFEAPSTPCDVVVLAGDICVNRRGLAWALEAFPDVPVIYVPGNHEYYGRAIPKLTEELREEAQGTNVHVLDCESVSIGGVRFLGCTFWTDMALDGDPKLVSPHAEQRMTDFKQVRVSPSFRRLQATDYRLFHSRAYSWLTNELLAERPGPTVVVTHHAPSRASLPEKYQGSPLSACYASRCDDLLNRCGPDLWIHGHVHASSDYRVGPTRVVCNPRGYDDEPVTTFDPHFTIELPAPEP